MPTYKITRPGVTAPRVVDASNPAAARQHVAKDEIAITKITVSEAFALAGQGVKLETAGEEPAPAPEPEPEPEELDPDRLREDKQERERLEKES